MDSPLSDDELMAQVNAGDKNAFALLYRRHNPVVFGFCMRFFAGNRGKAEDTAQEVWVRVANYSESYEPGNRFKYWALAIARRTALREFDKRKIKLDPLPEGESTLADEFNLEEALIERTQARKVQAAIESLPEAQRTVILLWVVSEKKYEEMAQELQLSMPALKSLLHRAKQSLIEALGGEDE